MPRAQFRFEVPGGLGVLSRKHRETEFWIVSNLPIADGLLVILDITPNTNATESLSRRYGLLPEYELLHADEQRLVIQYKLPSLPRHTTPSSPRGTSFSFRSRFVMDGRWLT